jgi:choline dehydrogenase-like flavoprotein
MLIDARTLPQGSVLDTDLAIVGAGPAGITLARALASARREICLIESGGLAYDADTQALYQGENAGIEYPLAGSRLRFLGGSSNHWGGYCRPLDPIDFEGRDWVPHSGWPFQRRELDPYYGPASGLVEVGVPAFENPTYWEAKTGEAIPPPATGRLLTRFFQFSPPTRFGERYRRDLEEMRGLRLLLNANVTRIGAIGEGRAVDALDLRTLGGRALRVRARCYVLAAGGLENPRLMLASNDVVKPGLGNECGLVGRFFMEHPHLDGFGEIVVADLRRLPEILRRRVVADGVPAQATFRPSAEHLRRRRLLNAGFMIGLAAHHRQGKDTHLTPERSAAHVDMLRAARRFLADGAGPLDPSDPSYSGAWFGIGCACEQAPNPDSRVTLADDRDPLGMAKLRLDWRLTETDRRSAVANIRALAMEFGTLGAGRMIMNVEDDGRWPEVVRGGNHHLGTTRMSDDPRQGVVDRNGRVHGMDNLYVAGSSVFPTAGAANPTLTILALTLRLADHLRERLG